MKTITKTICALLFIAGCSEPETKSTKSMVAGAATTASPSALEPSLDSARADSNWESYKKPGEHHELMNSWSGTWTGEVTMWESPGAEPTKSNLVAVNKMLLGGRYQQSVHKGKINQEDFEGIGTLAYDNAKKIFISTWIDNMGTGLMVAEGHWDPVTRSITLTGGMTDPSTGKEVEIREIFKPIDPHFHVMEMYAVGPDGNEFKTMEIRYTKKN